MTPDQFQHSSSGGNPLLPHFVTQLGEDSQVPLHDKFNQLYPRHASLYDTVLIAKEFSQLLYLLSTKMHFKKLELKDNPEIT